MWYTLEIVTICQFKTTAGRGNEENIHNRDLKKAGERNDSEEIENGVKEKPQDKEFLPSNENEQVKTPCVVISDEFAWRRIRIKECIKELIRECQGGFRE
ncbi:hypothetical protein FQR65_LT04339 [Abscondita terminalis]|nr:hypothetical protein FQR65_LT04339 [Abscondita terminalis]